MPFSQDYLLQIVIFKNIWNLEFWESFKNHVLGVNIDKSLYMKSKVVNKNAYQNYANSKLAVWYSKIKSNWYRKIFYKKWDWISW